MNGRFSGQAGRRGIALGAALAWTACTVGERVHSPPDAHFDLDVDAGADVEEETLVFPDATVDPCTDEGRGSTLGADCTLDAQCDDLCFCNGAERCEEGECVVGDDPCLDEVACTDDACLEELDACYYMPDHASCMDDDACNGAEVCDRVTGCRAGAPLYCNDDSACTVDSCDTAEGCVFTPRDLDGDGYLSGACGGEDCDDDPRTGTEVYPGAPELCSNRKDDNCDGRRDYSDPTCVPTNDDCASAEALDGPGTYSGSSSGLSGDLTFSCGTLGASSPDAVFKLTLDEEQDVRVSVAGIAGLQGLALRPWAACATGPDARCEEASPATLLHRSLPAGDYAVLVKTLAPGGAFDLNVTLSEATPAPAVDLCNGSTAALPADGATTTGNFEDTAHQYTLSCRSAGSFKDAAYRITLTEPQDVRIFDATYTRAGGFTRRAYMSLVTDCADPGSTVACVVGGTSGTGSEIHRRGLPAGTYYLILEGEADAVSWSFRSTVVDPVPRNPGDACVSAVALTDGAPAETVPWSEMEELDHVTTCGAETISTHRDAVFSFTLTEPRDVELVTNAAWTHAVALETTCGDSDTEIRCRTGGASGTDQTNVFRSLAAGTYYVLVTRTTTSTGDASAAYTTSAPTPVPGNDACAGAIDVSGGDYVSRDTVLDFDDDEDGCAAAARPDAFYTAVLTERSRITVAATPVGGLVGRTYLTLRDTCDAGGSGFTPVCAQSGSAGGTAFLTTVLDPGTYYVLVEMDATDPGDYDLQVFVVPEP